MLEVKEFGLGNGETGKSRTEWESQLPSACSLLSLYWHKVTIEVSEKERFQDHIVDHLPRMLMWKWRNLQVLDIS